MSPPLPPRYRTPAPEAARPSHGRRVSRLAAALGRPLLAWQAGAADLLGEHDPATGHRVHPLAVITTQRRAGKSSWLLTEGAERCLFPRSPVPQRVWFTSASGRAARERWEEFGDMLLAVPMLQGRVQRRLTNGSEKLIFPNGSTLRPFPPTREALHGEDSDLVIIDEAWSFDPTRGQELLQAISPTQATRPGAQIVLTSTMGDSQSHWFHGLCDRGRQGDLAYLEYSVHPDTDPATEAGLQAVIDAHPAVSGGLITPDYLRGQRDLMADSPHEFLRAFGNVRSAVAERVIPAATWAQAATGLPLPGGSPCLGVDVALDASETAIVAALDGVLEVIDCRPGTAWAADRIRDLAAKWHPAAIVIDRVGQSGVLADKLVRDSTRRRKAADRIELFPFTAHDYALSCQGFLDGLTNHTVRHRRHPALDAAVDAAARRPLGDGWAWSRRRATGSIACLVAATLASWADSHRPAVPERPLVLAG